MKFHHAILLAAICSWGAVKGATRYEVLTPRTGQVWATVPAPRTSCVAAVPHFTPLAVRARFTDGFVSAPSNIVITK